MFLSYTYIYIFLKPNLSKTFQEYQHYEVTNFHKMKYDLKGHKRTLLRGKFNL